MTDRSRLASVVDSIKDASVLCVGDVMLDRFVYGEAERISPEAPIPVLRITRKTAMLGGAGNVVRNLVALGAKPVFLSVVGDDQPGRDVVRLVGALNAVESCLLVEPERQTTIKTRYFAGHQQMLRADQETAAPLSERMRDEIAATIRAVIARVDVVALSDYGKGVLTPEVIKLLIEAARAHKKPVIVDPKGQDYRRYCGASILTPNRRELAEASQMPVGADDEIVAAARKLLDACEADAVLVTRSQDGMTLVERRGEVRHLPAEAREVFDVSGAGDTVVAAIAAALGRGATRADAAQIANVAAGIVVGKVGTAVAYAEEVVSALHHQDLWSGETKVLSLTQAKDRIAQWRAKGQRVGFTNGCFDLLHPGHVSLLNQARGACDKLVVGLNADASVQRLKGPTRPVQSEAARAAVLASLASVDMVVLFSEDTPLKLIEELRPDLLVKGADYTLDKVVGADIVQSYGGRVFLAQLEPGFSTTATIKKLST